MILRGDFRVDYSLKDQRMDKSVGVQKLSSHLEDSVPGLVASQRPQLL